MENDWYGMMGPGHRHCYYASPSVCQSRGKIRSVLLTDPLQMHPAMFSTLSTNKEIQEHNMQYKVPATNVCMHCTPPLRRHLSQPITTELPQINDIHHLKYCISGPSSGRIYIIGLINKKCRNFTLWSTNLTLKSDNSITASKTYVEGQLIYKGTKINTNVCFSLCGF